MKKIKLSAPGKIIISGEHAVVYGYPALVAAVDKRFYLTIKEKKNGWDWRFGPGLSGRLGLSGMGSSAVYAVLEAGALSFLVNRKLDKEKISKIAHEIENLAHGTASGVDTTVVTFGGMLFYQKGKGFEKLNFRQLPSFLLINTGKPVENTKQMIDLVKKNNCRGKLKQIGYLPKKLISALKKKNWLKLGQLIRENEKLLEEIGVVSEKAKKIIRQIEDLEGSAKICGAGGISKGSGIALAYHSDLSIIRKFCRETKLEYFGVKLGENGLVVEK